MDREALGSWLSGPRIERPTEDYHPGERLGLPQSGPGSVAGWGHRTAALVVDWFVALGVTMAVLGPPEPGDDVFSVTVLGVFVLEYVLMLLTAGRTIGMALFGLTVAPMAGARPRPSRVLLRTLLLAVVIPAVVYDRDRRGLHDKAGGTVVIRTR
jgi:uncharacterized RDD family membrane protein YckC